MALTADQLAELLNIDRPVAPATMKVLDVVAEDGHERRRVEYASPSGGRVPAYLLVPTEGAGPFPGIVVHHQHAGQRHLGKSEVCGLVRDPFQAFGPALARRGIVVLAPDSVCFEERRPHASGVDADEDADVLHHFNALAYGIVRDDLLMTTVLRDGLTATASLAALELVDDERIGLLGHSYGGNTVLFQTPVDARVAFACASGAACSYARRMADGTGIEFAQVIPGFTKHGDIGDLIALFAPRPTLIASASRDEYAVDAPELVAAARPAWGERDDHLTVFHSDGEHALTQERFNEIVAWAADAALQQPPS